MSFMKKVNTDQTPHNAMSDQDLRYLLTPVFNTMDSSTI